MYRCIITGLGGRGLGWAYAANAHKDVEVVGYAEPFEGSRERAIKQRGISADLIFNSADEAFDAVEADFVIDVTPPAVHHEIADKAFAKGLHVLGEKPLSDDYTVAKSVAEKSAKSGLKHMVAQNYRFDAGSRKMKQLVEQNAIGQIGQLDVQFYKAWADVPGSHYVTQPYMLVNDMMVHHFDLMRYLMGEVPTAVTAVTWNHPWGWHAGDAAHSIVFEFPGGLHATHVSIGCSVGNSRKDYFGDWRMDGSEGSLEWSEGKIVQAHMHRTENKKREEIFTDPVPVQMDGILGEFISALREDREPECNPADNIHSVAMVFAAIKSAKEKRRVELSELG